MANLRSEVEKANSMVGIKKPQAKIKQNQQADIKQKKAEIELMIEAKVSQALRLMR